MAAKKPGSSRTMPYGMKAGKNGNPVKDRKQQNVIKMIMGVRVSEEEEYEGLDLTECGMEAYPEFTGSKGSGI